MTKTLDAMTQLAAARRVGTPLVAISTTDQWALIDAVREREGGAEHPVLMWDCARGFAPLNEPGVVEIARLCDGELKEADIASGDRATMEELRDRTAGYDQALRMLVRFKPGGMVVCLNAHRFLAPSSEGSPEIAQGLSNLREPYKRTARTVLLLGPDFDLPPELTHEVVRLRDALPGDEALTERITGLYKAAKVKLPESLEREVSAVRGLSLFQAEQAAAMALRKSGVDMDFLWHLKREAVNGVKGLTLAPPSGLTLDDVRGLQGIHEEMESLFQSKRPPLLLVFIDEIEKALAGLAGDTSGTTKDQLGQILTRSEEKRWDGLTCVGAPGTGKSLLARALGDTYGVPTIRIDLGALKGQFVGMSEAAIRHALDVIEAIGGDRVFFIATCNDPTVIPPELKRRFRSGLWFFEAPSAAERDDLWKHYTKRCGVEDKDRPDGEWTGAEIRNICERAANRGISLKRAAKPFVPIVKSEHRMLEGLAAFAHGKATSASTGETFWKTTEDLSDMPKDVARKLAVPES